MSSNLKYRAAAQWDHNGESRPVKTFDLWGTVSLSLSCYLPSYDDDDDDDNSDGDDDTGEKPD